MFDCICFLVKNMYFFNVMVIHFSNFCCLIAHFFRLELNSCFWKRCSTLAKIPNMGRNSVVFIKYVKVTLSLLFTRFSFSSDISAIELSTKKGQRNFVLLFFKFHGITFRSPLGLNFVEYFCIKWYILIETCEIFTILLDEKHVTPNQTVPKSHGYFLLLVLLGDKD